MMPKKQHLSAGSRAPQRSKDQRSRRVLRSTPPGADLHVLIPELVWDPVQVSRLSAKTCWHKANNALIESFQLLGYNFKSVLCASPPSSSVPELMSVLKQWTAFWLPHMLNDQTPVQRFNPYELCSNEFRRFIKNRVTGHGKSRRIRIGALLLYSKRLFPAFTAEMVREKVSEFAQAVARPSPSILHRKKSIFREIWHSVHEVLGGEQGFVADYTKPFPPSVSACWENSRSEGGIQAWVLEEVLSKHQDDPSLRRVFSQHSLTLEELDPKAGFPELVWQKLLRCLLEAMEMDLEGDFENFPVAATGLTEPLKVRIVTKANWFLQLLSPVQKAWHSRMREHPIYELIGGADVESSLSGLHLKKGEYVVSGDYSAATDNIYLEYTEEAARAMLEYTQFRLPPGLERFETLLRQLALGTLTRSFLDLKGAAPVRITRGQMMGHILSFPLLCIINRSASCLAIPRSRFMKINGDDVIFPAKKPEYRQWKRATSLVGLEFSVGKNYFSRDLALVNSVFCVWDKMKSSWVRLAVPNVGLLNMPIDRQWDLRSGRQILPWEQLSQLFREFLSFSNEKNYQKFERMFRKYYPILRGFPGPLYGPVAYGCFGARVPSIHYQYSRNQLMWMNAHRLGIFNYLEGTRSDYTRVCNSYEFFIKTRSFLSAGGLARSYHLDFGVSELGSWVPARQDVYLNRSGQRIQIDPYERDGGLSSWLMCCRRWIVPVSSNKHVRIFGARRWNHFKLSRSKLGGIPPLPPNYLHRVVRNETWDYRPRWSGSRETARWMSKYEDDASFLHQIFRTPENERIEETT